MKLSKPHRDHTIVRSKPRENVVRRDYIPPRGGNSVDGLRHSAQRSVPRQLHVATQPQPSSTNPVVIVRHRPLSAKHYHMSSITTASLSQITERRLGNTARMSGLLQQALAQAAEDSSNDFSVKSRKSAKRHVLSFATIAVLVLTSYVSYDTWQANRKVSATNQPSMSATTAQGNKTAIHTSGEPDQTPLPKNALSDYTVAADEPRAVFIDKIGVAARALPMSTNSDNSMQAPFSAYDAGWYIKSSKPGEVGAILIDGHSSGSSKLGVFGKLGDLNVGDIVTIETGSMKRYSYKVSAKETVPKNKVDMQKAMLPYGKSVQGANFITCAGEWTDDGSTLTDRTVVYTERVY